jgi:hypothetical protein
MTLATPKYFLLLYKYRNKAEVLFESFHFEGIGGMALHKFRSLDISLS